MNTVRELLPQLRNGKITRGMIGVSVGIIPAEALDELGLKDRKGALVATVSPGGPADKAGMEPGDVIVAFNGKPVASRDELVRTVVGIKPGTKVDVKVIRDKQEKNLTVTVDELNLEEEGRSASREGGGGSDDEEASSGFGLTLGNITPDATRELRLDPDTRGALVTDVEPQSPAARAGLTRGDVITRVNRRPVTSAAEAGRELAKVESGRTALLLVLRNGQETFLTVTKE